MHRMSCRCAHCRTGGEAAEFETLAFPSAFEAGMEAFEAGAWSGQPVGEAETPDSPDAASGRWTRRSGLIVVEGA
jgi:hypothetical protein